MAIMARKPRRILRPLLPSTNSTPQFPMVLAVAMVLSNTTALPTGMRPDRPTAATAPLAKIHGIEAERRVGLLPLLADEAPTPKWPLPLVAPPLPKWAWSPKSASFPSAALPLSLPPPLPWLLLAACAPPNERHLVPDREGLPTATTPWRKPTVPTIPSSTPRTTTTRLLRLRLPPFSNSPPTAIVSAPRPIRGGERKSSTRRSTRRTKWRTITDCPAAKRWISTANRIRTTPSIVRAASRARTPSSNVLRNGKRNISPLEGRRGIRLFLRAVVAVAPQRTRRRPRRIRKLPRRWEEWPLALDTMPMEASSLHWWTSSSSDREESKTTTTTRRTWRKFPWPRECRIVDSR
mmetsp:Transcript_1123/g.2524  ORF Transcript_1123/g.2524 Transcript_1123/m.2524 type:complete len:350 (+) Transcript_1123:193-1242(+)